MKKGKTEIRDISRKVDEALLDISPQDWMPLPCSYAHPSPIKPLTEEQEKTLACSLDGVSALRISRPKNGEEEKKMVESFLGGLKKLLSRQDNWTFWQPLVHSLQICVRCQTCNDACPIYVSSGKQEIYRPTYRSEILRRMINKYLHKGGKAFAKLKREDIELNWAAVARLAELAYRCAL